MNVADLVASLSLNTQQFSKNLDKAVKDAQKAAKDMQKSFNNIHMKQVNKGVESLVGEAKKAGSAFKDVNRIVQGIVISQTFYRGANAIQAATSELINYNMEMERAELAFKYMLGSAEEGKKFTSVLQDFAATTPYTTAQAVQSSRQLMAMGFSAKEVLPVLRILSDASAVSGGTEDQFNRIVYAMGQIKTTGRLVKQDLMQLAQAGIPVFQILQEELGLTGEQVQNIGKAGISASEGLSAIFRWLNKEYGGASKEISETTSGMLSTIKDDLLIIGRELTTGFMDSFGGLVRNVRDTLEQVRQVISKFGVGGLIEHFVPPEMRSHVRYFVGMLGQMVNTIGQFIAALKPVYTEVVNAFIIAFNAVSPAILAFLRVLTGVIQTITKYPRLIRAFALSFMALAITLTVSKWIAIFSAAVKSLGVVGTAAKLIMKLAGTFKYLYAAMTAHPIVAIATIIGAALLSIAMSSKHTAAWIDRLMASLGRLFGFNIEDILSPDDPGSVGDSLNDYNQSVDDLINGLEGVGDAGEDAGKQVEKKFIASFDEVFQVPEALDEISGTLGGIGDSIPSFGDDLIGEMPSYEDVEVPEWKWPEWPPFPPFPPLPPLPQLPTFDPILLPVTVIGMELVRNMVDELKRLLASIPRTVSIGVSVVTSAALAALRVFSNALAKVPRAISVGISVVTSAALDGLRGLVEALSKLPSKVTTVVELLAPAFLPTLGAIVSGISGVLLPGLASIPAFFKGTVFPAFDEFLQKLRQPLPGFGDIYNAIKSMMLPGFELLQRSLQDSLIPGLLMVPQTIQGTVLPLFDEFVDKLRGQIVTAVQELPGKVASALSNGATVVATSTALLCSAVLKPFARLGADVLSVVATGFASVIQFFVDLPSKIGNAVAPIKEKLSTGFSSAFEGVQGACSTFMDWMEGKWGWLAGILATIVGGIAITMTGGWTAVGGAIMSVVTPMLGGITNGFSTLMSGSLPGILGKGGAVLASLFSVFTGSMSTAFADSKDNVISDSNEMNSQSNSIFSNMKTSVSNAFNDMKSSISEKWNSVKTATTSTWENMKTSVTNTISSMNSSISNTFSTIKSSISTAWNSCKTNTTNAWNTIKSSVSTITSSMRSTVSSALSSVSSTVSSVWNSCKSVTSSAWNSMKNIISGVMDGIKNVVSTGLNWIKSKFDWITSTAKSISNAVSSVFSGSSRAGMVQVEAQQPVSPAAYAADTMRNSGVSARVSAPMSRATQAVTKSVASTQRSVEKGSSVTADDIAEAVSKALQQNQQYTNNQNNDIMYVGTLIADDRGLKELERRMQVVRLKESARRG